MMNPARYSDAGSTFCGPVGSGTAKTTGSAGEKLDGRVEEKEVVVVERNAVKKMRDLVFYSDVVSYVVLVGGEQEWVGMGGLHIWDEEGVKLCC
jgi:hypothetical protein